MRGRGPVNPTPKTTNSYVTGNDSAWIKKLNPYDKVIANKSVKTLNAISKLVGKFEPNLKSSDMADQVKALTKLKSRIVQEAMNYTGFNKESIGSALGNTFKDIGLTIVGKGWLWESGQEKLESVTEKKAKITAALDDLLNQARNKGQEALSQLNQLYLKQGDREEQQQIRDKEEKKMDDKTEQLRKKDKEESLPDYQRVDEVNPLGFSSGKRYMKVDPNNLAQVKSVRNNPMLREQDKSYYKKNSATVRNINFDAHRSAPVVVNNDVQKQRVAQQITQKNLGQTPNASW